MNAIEIRGVEKTFPKFKLGPIDLTVPQGAIYGLIGPNGAGKTTALELIFGLGRAEAGTIRVMGLDHEQDEPTVGLDAPSRQQVFGELLAAVQEEDRSVLISSHNLSDLERLADHIGIINHGKMLMEGQTSLLLEVFKMVDFTLGNGCNARPWEGLLLNVASFGINYYFVKRLITRSSNIYRPVKVDRPLA